MYGEFKAQNHHSIWRFQRPKTALWVSIFVFLSFIHSLTQLSPNLKSLKHNTIKCDLPLLLRPLLPPLISAVPPTPPPPLPCHPPIYGVNAAGGRATDADLGARRMGNDTRTVAD